LKAVLNLFIFAYLDHLSTNGIRYALSETNFKFDHISSNGRSKPKRIYIRDHLSTWMQRANKQSDATVPVKALPGERQLDLAGGGNRL